MGELHFISKEEKVRKDRCKSLCQAALDKASIFQNKRLNQPVTYLGLNECAHVVHSARCVVIGLCESKLIYNNLLNFKKLSLDNKRSYTR